jgi:hypothetical protein
MRRLLVLLGGTALALSLNSAPAGAQTKPDKPATPPAAKAAAGTASGVVSAVTPSSLTVKGKEEMTFEVDSKTKIQAKGASTKTAENKAAGKPTQITDVVAVGDTVTVKYADMDGKKHASDVRVTKKGT